MVIRALWTPNASLISSLLPKTWQYRPISHLIFEGQTASLLSLTEDNWESSQIHALNMEKSLLC